MLMIMLYNAHFKRRSSATSNVGVPWAGSSHFWPATHGQKGEDGMGRKGKQQLLHSKLTIEGFLNSTDYLSRFAWGGWEQMKKLKNISASGGLMVIYHDRN